ncbi:MAG TPA: RHS repeat-associated core domain-containing protein, partial [Polyangia bacterium]
TKSVDAAGLVTEVVYDSLGRVLQKSDPDQGLWRYGYSATGQITSEIDAKGQTTTLELDELGRVRKRIYPNGTYDAFVFDEGPNARGRLTTAAVFKCPGCTDLAQAKVVTQVGYDVMGHRTSFSQTMDGTTYTIRSQYQNGRLTSETYPDGEVVTYVYGTAGTALGRLTGVTGSQAGVIVADVAYDSRGQMSTITYGNGVTTSYLHDPSSDRTTRIAIGALANIDYGYDAAGRVTTMSSGQLGLTNWTFAYDDLNRLTKATNLSDGTRTQSFGYDAVGRMTSNSASGAYVYGDVAHPHGVTAVGTNTYTYDANGSLVSGGGRTLFYDGDRRLAKVVSGGLTTYYRYDALGQRVRKCSGQGTTVYVGGIYETGSRTIKYYLAGGMRVASRAADGTMSFYHADHLGSLRLISDISGHSVRTFEYAPFGKLLTTSGTLTDTHRFTGQEADDESGLMFYQARFYDPELGRFVQPDQFLPDGNFSQALDPYAYAYNSPINYVDPSGHAPLVAAIAVGLGASVATGVAIATTYALVINLAIVAIGTALTMYSNNAVLQSIGMVLAGAAGACIGAPLWGLGAGMEGTVATMNVGALVSLAESPISPLDPTVKQAIAWAYTVWGTVSTVERLAHTSFGLALKEQLPIIGSWKDSVPVEAARQLGIPGAIAVSVVGEAAMTALGGVAAWGVSYASLGVKQVFAFVLGCYFTAYRPNGVLSGVGATYGLAYTLAYPDGRTYDLRDGGEGRVAFSVYYHTGYENPLSLGRQHIRIGDGGGYWELGNQIGYFGPGLGWGGWISTQKVTVIMTTAQAAVFRAVLAKGAESKGGYIIFHADSYAYPDLALRMATGHSMADLHINPGLFSF